MKCIRTSKRTKKRCNANAMTGREVCYHHGGKTPRGIASANFVTGKYSKDLPTRMLSSYTKAKADATLLELRDEVALIHARATDLIGRVDSGESGHLWKLLLKTWDNVNKARQSGNTAELVLALTELGQLIQRGVADYAAWEEVCKQIDRKQRLVESERRRYVEMQDMMTSKQVMVLVVAITEAIRRHVRDRDILAALSADISQLIGAGSSGDAKAAGV